MLLGASGNNYLNSYGGTLTIGQQITVRGSSGNFNDGTLVNQGTILADQSGGGTGGAIAIFVNAFTNEGTIGAAGSDSLAVDGLSGDLGTVLFTGSGNRLSLTGTDYAINQALTVPAGSTLSLAGSWTDNSTITATGGTLNLGDQSNSSANGWTNAGTITATNSTVNLGGLFTFLDFGALNGSGDSVNLVGTLNNAGATLALNAATGSWNLLGGTLLGGTLSEADGAGLAFTSSGGTLDGVTAAGNLDLASNSYSYAYVADGLTLDNATVFLGNASGTTSGSLDFSGTETLGGEGTVLLGASGANFLNYYGAVLTIGQNIAVQGGNGNLNGGELINEGTICGDGSGSGGTLAINAGAFANQGILQAGNGETLNVNGLTGNMGNVDLSGAGTSLTLNGSNYAVNQGLTATAGETVSLGGVWSNAVGSAIDISGATLTLGSYSNTWTNSGTIDAANSTVNLGGQFTSLDLGSFTYSASSVNLVGTLDNTGAILAFSAATGSWNLVGGTLKGGTLSQSGGAELVFTSSGGTLDGVTTASDLDLASHLGAYATIADGLTLENATIYLGDASGTINGRLYFSGTETLDGTGTLLFGKSGNNVVSDYSGTLTIGSGITVRGSSGTLINGSGTLINQGIISADDSGGLVGGFVYDAGFSGGWSDPASISSAIDASAVSNPAPQAVYQTFRYGNNFSYDLGGLTPSADYTLRLDFAEGWYNAAGQQQFDVSINGSQVLTDFDIYAAAGGEYKAVAETFAATTDANGQITVTIGDGLAGNAQINGIEVFSLPDSAPVEQIDCGLLPGGTIAVNPGAFTNEGTIEATGNGSLSVNGLSGNIGTVAFSGSGNSLSLAGTNYFVNQPLVVPAGSTLSLAGSWTDTSTITATGATLNMGDRWSNSSNRWYNDGTIAATNCTLNLGGLFSFADLFNSGAFDYTGGAVNLVGTLDNIGTTLALDAATGSWNLAGGTLLGGTLSESDGAQLVFTSSGGTLVGVTTDSDLDLTGSSNPCVFVQDGLRLDNATIYLGDASGTTNGDLYFSGTQTLDGTGALLFGKSGNNVVSDYSGTLTIGSGITVRGSGGTLINGGGTLINQGTICADDSGGLVGGFVYDAGFNGGWSDPTSISSAIDASAVSNPAPQAVYQTFRYGNNFSYDLGGLTPNADYTLQLDFAEGWYNAAGQQQFNVSIDGSQVLTHFDIYAAAGGEYKAVAETFTATTDANGQITVTFSDGPAGNAQINGIEVLSLPGGAPIAQIDCGLLPGGTIAVNPSDFINEGTIEATGSGSLSVNGLSGNIGAVAFSGSGNSLSLAGTNYVVNQPLAVPAGSTLSCGGTGYVIQQSLSAPAGSTLSLTGSWTNQSTIAATGAALNLGDPWSNSTNRWNNAGTITVADCTVNLGGTFTLAGLGVFNHSAATVNLTGTLDDTGTTLALNAATGSWNLSGGTLLHGALSESGGAELVFTSSGGTLDGVTTSGNLDLTGSANVYAYVANGLTLDNATIYLGNASGMTYGTLYFEGTQTLGGAGTVLFGKSGANNINNYWGGAGLTIGPQITLRGSNGNLNGGTLVNEGTICADDSGGLVGGFAYDAGFTGGWSYPESISTTRLTSRE